jgi:hypothetical protein
MSSTSEQQDRIQQLRALLPSAEASDLDSETSIDNSALRKHLIHLDEAAAALRAAEKALLDSYGNVRPTDRKARTPGISLIHPLSGVTLSTPFIHSDQCTLRRRRKGRSSALNIASAHGDELVPSFKTLPSFVALCQEGFKRPTVRVENFNHATPPRLASAPQPPKSGSGDISLSSRELDSPAIAEGSARVRLKHLRERERAVVEQAAALRRVTAALMGR